MKESTVRDKEVKLKNEKKRYRRILVIYTRCSVQFSSAQFELHVYILYSNLFRLFGTFFSSLVTAVVAAVLSCCVCNMYRLILFFLIHAHSLLLFCSISFCCYWKFQTFCFVPVRLINISPHSCIYTTALIVKMKKTHEKKRKEEKNFLFVFLLLQCACLPACLFLFSSYSILNKFRILCSLLSYILFAFLTRSFRFIAIVVYCWCLLLPLSFGILLMSSFYRCFVWFRFNSVLDWYVLEFEISQAELRKRHFHRRNEPNWCVFGLVWLFSSLLFFTLLHYYYFFASLHLCIGCVLPLSLFISFFSYSFSLIRWLVAWLTGSLAHS